MIEPDDTPGIPEPIRRRIVDTLAAGGTLTSIPYVKSVPLRYGQVDCGRLAEFLGLLDGSDAARVLAMYENELTDDELLRLLPSTFLAADSPPLWVSDDRWVEMWNRVGFTIDGHRRSVLTVKSCCSGRSTCGWRCSGCRGGATPRHQSGT